MFTNVGTLTLHSYYVSDWFNKVYIFIPVLCLVLSYIMGMILFSYYFLFVYIFYQCFDLAVSDSVYINNS